MASVFWYMNFAKVRVSYCQRRLCREFKRLCSFEKKNVDIVARYGIYLCHLNEKHVRAPLKVYFHHLHFYLFWTDTVPNIEGSTVSTYLDVFVKDTARISEIYSTFPHLVPSKAQLYLEPFTKNCHKTTTENRLSVRSVSQNPICTDSISARGYRTYKAEH